MGISVPCSEWKDVMRSSQELCYLMWLASHYLSSSFSLSFSFLRVHFIRYIFIQGWYNNKFLIAVKNKISTDILQYSLLFSDNNRLMITKYIFKNSFCRILCRCLRFPCFPHTHWKGWNFTHNLSLWKQDCKRKTDWFFFSCENLSGSASQWFPGSECTHTGLRRAALHQAALGSTLLLCKRWGV